MRHCMCECCDFFDTILRLVNHPRWSALMSRNDYAINLNADSHLGECHKKTLTMNDIEPIEILLGRGPTCYNNLGNQRFREVMKLYLSDYAESVSKSKKHTTILIENLWSKLLIQGFRFRCRSKLTGEWVDAPECMAKEKVAHSLRDYSKRIPGVCYKSKQKNLGVNGNNKGLPLRNKKKPTKQRESALCNIDIDKLITKWEESFNPEFGLSVNNYFAEMSDSHELEGTSLTSLLSNQFHLNDHDTGNNYCNCIEGYEGILNHNIQSLFEVTDFLISEGKRTQYK